MPLPSILSSALIRTIRSQPCLPPNTWYLLAATTLTTLNRPNELPTVFTHAIEKGGGSVDTRPSANEQLAISRRIREALIKSSAIIGLPKAINALFALRLQHPKTFSTNRKVPRLPIGRQTSTKRPHRRFCTEGNNFSIRSMAKSQTESWARWTCLGPKIWVYWRG